MTARIAYLGDPTRHFWLTRSVARAIEVNLSEAMAQGLLSARGYAEMVTRCRRCPHVAECQSWLAENGGSATRAPAQCANRDTLNELAERLVR
mgnify:CR=1 FL=1